MEDNTYEENEEDSFATEIAKSFTISLATTAGMYGGLIAVTAASNALKNRKLKKENQKKENLKS